MINRCVLIILMLFASFLIKGQEIPLSDQYLNNTLAINPAFAGSHDALSATLSYRNQWVGFRGAPENLIFSLHAPFKNDRVGLGFLVERSSFGIYNTTAFTGNYAYRLEFSDGTLSLGLGFGASVYNLAWSKLSATDPDDARLMNNTPSSIMPDFSLGAYYYNHKYFAGISLPRFLSHDLNRSSGKYTVRNDISRYTYLITGGYYFDLGPRTRMLPSAMLKMLPGHAKQADLNVQLILDEKIWIGAGYRTNKVLVGMLQCQLNRQLRLAYSYDFDGGKIGKYSNGSHEALLCYVFSYERKVTGPRQF